jgi:uncharacterized protein (DUF169 family)
MLSGLAEAIALKNNPVALIWSDAAPTGAMHFKSGRWGCVASLFGSVAKTGRTAVLDRDTYGCWGGGVGLGFGNCYEKFPGGFSGFCGFLADGNSNTETGRQIGEGLAQSGAKELADDFLNGERYMASAEATQRFVQALPMVDIAAPYVVLKPLSAVDPEVDNVKNVTFFVEPDALSALVILVNRSHPERENVGIPYAAGCQVLGILAYKELASEHPRALVGLTDLSARQRVRGSLGRSVMSFTIPWPMFLGIEQQVDSSFLQRNTWQSLLQ